MGGCSSRAAAETPQPETSSAAVTVVKEKKTQPDAAQLGQPATGDGAEATTAEQREPDHNADDAGSSGGKQEEAKEETREAAAPQAELRTKAEEETKESSGSGAATAELEAVSSSQPARLSVAREITPRAVATAPVPAVADEWPERPPGSASSAAAAASSSDAEFRLTVRSVLVLLLDRLTRTLEYEKAAFQELAAAVGLSNYMQLLDFAAFESFLRANFSIPPSPSPQQQDTDLRYLSQYFSLFLTLASNASAEQTGGRVFPSRVEMTLELQRLCSETSTRLLQWSGSPAASPEAVEHLRFFSQAMQFAKGDLVHNPQLLQQNIADICD